MFMCVCGHASKTEADLRTHFIECHSRAYGLECRCSLAAPENGQSQEQLIAA